MSKRERLMEMAVLAMGAGVSLAASDAGFAAPKKGEKPAECFAMTKPGDQIKKGENGCAVGKDQIEAANKVFKNKYANTKPIDCAGNADADSLAWKTKPNNTDCFAAGGFVFEKDAKGKLIVRDKDGIKTPS